MSTILIIFPPGAGGNHLRNVVISCLKQNSNIASVYSKKTATKHARVGHNLQLEDIEYAMAHDEQVNVLHGHFGEIMSYQTQIRSIADKKFVILCPDTAQDRKLLNNRRRKLHQQDIFSEEGYFDQEQVFLYEPFMYHWYFQVSMDNIMNIPISEWFVRDIDRVLDRLSWLLKINVDKTSIGHLHHSWLEENGL